MTTTTLGAFNEESQKVMNYMQGKRTAEQMVGEFFGLRKEAIYDNEGNNVVDFINDFKDEEALKLKKVHLHPMLKEKGITDEMFAKLFNKVPNYGSKGTTRTNSKGKGAKSSNGSNGSSEVKSELPNTDKGTEKSEK